MLRVLLVIINASAPSPLNVASNSVAFSRVKVAVTLEVLPCSTVAKTGTTTLEIATSGSGTYSIAIALKSML